MPKSKREKKVSLTKTKRKGLEMKNKIIEEIRGCITKYQNVFVFSVENMRNTILQDIRLHWKENSRLFLGKNKVMALALGRTSQEEIAENIRLISQKLVGTRGLFLTNASREEVLEYFDNLYIPIEARAGNIAVEAVALDKGLLDQFPHSLEPYLRKLGLPVELQKGIPSLTKPYVICKAGDILNPEQAKLLKLFRKLTAQFHLKMEFLWSQEGAFEDLGRATNIEKPQKKRLKRGRSEGKKTPLKEMDLL